MSIKDIFLLKKKSIYIKADDIICRIIKKASGIYYSTIRYQIDMKICVINQF